MLVEGLLQWQFRELSFKIPICYNHVLKSQAKAHTFLYPPQVQQKQMLGSSTGEQRQAHSWCWLFSSASLLTEENSRPQHSSGHCPKGQQKTNPRLESLSIRRLQRIFKNCNKNCNYKPCPWNASHLDVLSVILTSPCSQGKLTHDIHYPQ